MEFGILGILSICAVLTLISVGVASYITVIGAVIFYQWQKEAARRLEAAPAELARAIDKAVAEFVLPYREAMDKRGVEPIKKDEIFDSQQELEEWLNS